MRPFPQQPVCPTPPWTSRTVHNTTVWDGLTPETFAQFELSIKVYEQCWKEFLKTRIEIVNEYSRLLIAEGFPATFKKQVRGGSRPKYETITLGTHLMECLPKVSMTMPYIGYAKKYLEEQQKKEHEKVVEKAHQALQDRAVQWLLGKGYTYGKEFNALNAISVANDLAYEEEVNKRREDIKASESAFIEFCGSDYCEDCSGWDGESHRCECGNRRVSWTTADWHTFDHPSIFAEAY